MEYTQGKASKNSDIFKIELNHYKSSTARPESGFQTFPQKNSQNNIRLSLLKKSENQLSNTAFNDHKLEKEM